MCEAVSRRSGARTGSYTLSRVLNDLEEEGFITNRKEFESPVASYYTLTEKGDALCPVFESLDAWGGDWLNYGIRSSHASSGRRGTLDDEFDLCRS